MGVGRFEDLVAWQKARELTKVIYHITQKEEFAKDYGLREQLRRAAVSMMSNIAEGFERANPNEFHHFLVMAKASCAEIRSQLYVALDANYLSQNEFTQLRNQSQEVSRIIGGLRASVKNQQKL